MQDSPTAQKARQLIEVGFEYVNEIHGIHLYRKRTVTERARFNNLAGPVGFEPTTINSAG